MTTFTIFCNIPAFPMFRSFYAPLLITVMYLASSGVLAQNTRKVLVEDITGAWCGFCPDGAASMAALQDVYGNQIIPVAVHVGDSMQNTISAIIGDEYTGNGVNAFMIDRYLFDDESFVQLSSTYTPLETHIAERLAMPPIVQVSFDNVNYNPVTRQLSVIISAVFDAVPLENDVRLNLWITQDSIVGSGTGYNQANFFNAYPGHPYFGAGNTILNFTHRHVLRAGLSGAWGSPVNVSPNAGIVPNTVYYQSYTLTLPNNWNADRLSLIGLVQCYDESHQLRPILNAADRMMIMPEPNNGGSDTTTATSTNLPDNYVNNNNAVSLQNVHIFPNPVSHLLQATFDLKHDAELQVAVNDISGRVVTVLQTGSYAAGQHHLQWNMADLLPELPNGSYWLSIDAQGQYVGKPFQIKR